MSFSDDAAGTPEEFDATAWKMFQQVVEDCPVAVFVTDTAGRHLFVNRQWCELTGLAPAQALGWGWEHAVHPADVQVVLRQWRRLITVGDGLWVRLRVVRPRGATSSTIMHAVATPDRDGRRRFVGTLTPVGVDERSSGLTTPPLYLRLAHLRLAPWPSLLDRPEPAGYVRQPQPEQPLSGTGADHAGGSGASRRPPDRGVWTWSGASGDHSAGGGRLFSAPAPAPGPERGAAVAGLWHANRAGSAETVRQSSTPAGQAVPHSRPRPATHEAGCDCLSSQLLRAEIACHVRELWLVTMLEELPMAALLADADCRVEAVNQAYCDLFELPESPSDLVGTDCRLLLRPPPGLVDDPSGFASRLAELIRRRRSSRRESVMFADGRVFERSHVPLGTPGGVSDDGYAGHMWTYVDVTARRILEAETEGLIAD